MFPDSSKYITYFSFIFSINSKFDDSEEANVDNGDSEISVNSSSDTSGSFLK